MSQYVDWGAWGYVQKGAADWNDDALADAATETSDALDLDQKVAAEVGIKLVEDNTGACDGDVTVHILRATGDDGGGTEEFESATEDTPLAFTITPEQNTTKRRAFALNPHIFRICKIAVENQAGQELAVTVEYRTATIGESA